MTGRGARPLKAASRDLVAVESGVRDARIGGREACDLVHHLGGGEQGLRVAHAVHDERENLGVGLGVACNLHSLAHALHAALGIGEGAVLLGVAAARQHHVGIPGRLGEEEIVHHEEVERLQGMDDVVRVGVGAHGVLAEDEEAAQAPLDHGGEALGGLEAGRVVELCAPGCLELCHDLGVCHLLVTSEVGGHGAHVAGALHVVLAADGVHAAALAAQLAAGHGDVGERHDAFGAAGVFRHAQAVDDGGALGACVHVRGGHEVVLADAADARDLVGRVVGHERLEGLEPFGLLRDEVAVY